MKREITLRQLKDLAEEIRDGTIIRVFLRELPRRREAMRMEQMTSPEQAVDVANVLKSSINEHVEASVMKNGGIEQVRLFVITCRREDASQARDYFRSIEANLMADFKSLGSILIPLSAVERLKYLHAFYHLGHETDYDFTIEDMIRRRADWKDYISSRMLRQAEGEYGEKDGKTLQIDERYVRAMYLPKMPNAIDPDKLRKLTGGTYHVILTIDVEAIPPEVAKKKVSNQLLRNGREIEKQQETRNKAWAWSSDISYDKRRAPPSS